MRPLQFFFIISLWCGICPLYSQYNISIDAPEYSGFCQEITVGVELEKLINTSYNDLSLVIAFSEPVDYLDQTLILGAAQISDQQIILPLDDQISCFYESGDISFIPRCTDLTSSIEIEWKVLQSGDCIGQAFTTTTIQSPIIDIAFSDYTFSAENNTLSKTLTLTNIGLAPLEAFDISLLFDDDFASLLSASSGTIAADRLLYSNTDLESLGFADGLMAPQAAFDVELTFSVDRCEIRSVQYDILFGCDQAACTSQLIFVDENEIYDNNLEAEFASSGAAYGLCQAAPNELIISNRISNAQTVLGDVYQLSLVLKAPSGTTRRRRFNECIQFSAVINGIELPIRNDNDERYIIDLTQLTSDPDGPGGLSDLNADGSYSDLALGDSTSLSINIIIKNGCQSSYHTLDTSFEYELVYQNYCGLFNRSTSRRTQQKSNGISPYFNGSFGTIDDFISGDNNQSFVPDQDTFTISYNIRRSSNISRICGNEMLELTIDAPSTVRLDPSQDIRYVGEEDTLLLIPTIIQDTLISFELTELQARRRASIELTFIGSCELMADTNYDPAIDVCDQCVEYMTPRFRATLTKPCTLPCPIDVPASESVSEDFFVACPDIPELEPAVIAEPLEIYRLTNGYVDLSETVRRDPFARNSVANNVIFFDSDTVMMRIPFTFGCQSSLSSFEFLLQTVRYPLDALELISSELKLIEAGSGSVLGQCPADIFLTKTEDQISAFFTSANFILPCIEEQGVHYLDMTMKVNFDCFTRNDQNCEINELGTIRTVTNTTLTTGCSKRLASENQEIAVNEIFREEHFKAVERFIDFSLPLFRTQPLRTELYSPSFIRQVNEIEYRHTPILREISYKVPPGFELISDLNFTEASYDPGLFDPSSPSFLQSQNRKFTNVNTLNATITQNPDGSQSYTFSDDLTKYYSGQVGAQIYAETMLKSVCPPDEVVQELIVSGIIEYVDYAYGSLDTIDFPFSRTIDLSFNQANINIADDFQVIDQNRIVNWTLSNSEAIFPGQFVPFLDPAVDERTTEELNYYLRYRSSGTARIDSIIASRVGFSEQISSFVADSDSTLEISFRSFFLDENNDTISSQLDPMSFAVYSTNHACGFDTIFYELGKKASFISPECGEIIRDTLVSYSPPGLPLLTWDDTPREITTSGDNGLAFTIANVGQGDLIDQRIIMSGLPQADYLLLFLHENGEQEDISRSLSMKSDTLTSDLSVVGKDMLSGVGKDSIAQYSFLLKVTNICTQEKFFSLSVQSRSKSYCGVEFDSPALRLARIPFVKSNQQEYETIINSFAPRDCDGNINAEVRFIREAGTTASLMNPQFEIYSPRDLTLVPNGIKVNGRRIANPTVEVRDTHNVYVIAADAQDLLTDSEILIEIEFDGNCIDVCREDLLSAFLFADEEISCGGGGTGLQTYARGFDLDKTLRWRPIFDVSEYEYQASLEGDSLRLDLDIELVKEAEPAYAGKLYINFFKDINGNGRIDGAETSLLSDTIVSADFAELSYRFQPSVLMLLNENACQFTMSFNTEQSCACTNRFFNILRDQQIQIQSNVSYCDTGESFMIPYRSSLACATNIPNQPNVLSSGTDSLLYMPSAPASVDSVIAEYKCGSCDFIETTYLRRAMGAVEISLDSSQDCELTANAIWNNGDPIPDNFNISWSHDVSAIGSTIKNPPAGMLRVTLEDGRSCRFDDELMIDETLPLDYTITTDAPDCPQVFPIDLTVVPSGTPPFSIAWADGGENLLRTDISPGSYDFTLRDGLGCELSDRYTITAPASIIFTAEAMQPTCFDPEGGQIMISSDQVGLEYALGDDEYRTESIFANLEEGTYKVYARSPVGCVDSSDVTLTVTNELVIPTPAFLIGFVGDRLELNPDLIDSSTWSWTWSSDQLELSCTDCPNPSMTTPAEDARIKVTLEEGICSVEKVVTVRAEYSDLIYAPNIFSPNQDGQNDHYYVFPHSTFDDITVWIYDRWGNQMYEHTQSLPIDPAAGWNGMVNDADAAAGIYVFKAIINRAADDSVIERFGTFQLVR